MNKFKLICTTFVIVIFLPMKAQEKGIVGISFSAINNNVMLRSGGIERKDYETIRGQGFISFSLDYRYPFNGWLSAETGVNYSYQKFERNFLPSAAHSTFVSEKMDFNVVNIPVGLRFDFLKYGFINSGLLIDLVHNPGIGTYFGAGAKIESAIGFGMYINPYVKAHSMFPVNFNINSDRIFEMGVKIGVTYSLNNK